jgi:predicted nuclease of predicted toxin-antitoxin system
MKLLLFDQNLSPSLIGRLADLYPNTMHIQSLGLSASLDRIVWDYAHQHYCH